MSRSEDRDEQPPAAPLVEELAGAFLDRHPAEAAAAMRELPIGDVIELLSARPPERAAEALQRFEPEQAASVLADAPDELAGALLTALDPARAARILARLDPARRRARLALVPGSRARDIETFSLYPPDTAGGLMDGRVLAFGEHTSVGEALEHLPSVRDRRIADVLIVDADGRLVGAVPLQSLIGADPEEPLGARMQRNPPSVHPMAPSDEVVDLLERHRLATLPVVDLQGHLVGVLRGEVLLETAQQDAAADLQAMVGAAKHERALWRPWQAIRARLPWLHVNLLTAFLASAVVALFDETIAQYTALAVLLPVVAGQSGNTGAQALAVTTRGLALREIGVSYWWRIVRKEFAVGLVAGIAIALVTAGGVYAWSGTPGLALVIGIAMVFSMALAAVAGAIIPIGLTALGRDPATASSILLTTATDVIGFASFLGLATALSSLLG